MEEITQKRMANITPDAAEVSTTELNRPLSKKMTHDQHLLYADIRALEKRLSIFSIKSEQECLLLLSIAEETGITDENTKAGREIFAKAANLYSRERQGIDRFRYLRGVLIGLVILAVITAVVAYLAKTMGEEANLTSSPMIISIFMLSALGCITSILTRISEIDLRQEKNKQLIYISGGARPIVAASFASIIYIILQSDVVTISGFQGEYAFYIAAYLCGFSERFASDILETFTKS